jgi:hypothetical protein
MALISIIIATTLTLVDGSKHTQSIAIKESNISVISPYMCNTPQSIKHMAELKHKIEGTKVSKIVFIDCINE